MWTSTLHHITWSLILITDIYMYVCVCVSFTSLFLVLLKPVSTVHCGSSEIHLILRCKSCLRSRSRLVVSYFSFDRDCVGCGGPFPAEKVGDTLCRKCKRMLTLNFVSKPKRTDRFLCSILKWVLSPLFFTSAVEKKHSPPNIVFRKVRMFY